MKCAGLMWAVTEGRIILRISFKIKCDKRY